jgi:RNA polymerase sigma-70 factor (ECF subfamily)
LFALHQEAAECDYLGGHFVEAEGAFDWLLGRARTRLDKAKIYALKVLQYEHMSRYAETIRTGREGLTSLDSASLTCQLYLFKQTREMGMHAWNSDPAALVLEKFEAKQVCQAIAALPEDYCIVSALYFMEEFSYQEIAEMVGCPVGTVRSRLHRGRRMLQKALWHIAEQQGIITNLHASGE